MIMHRHARSAVSINYDDRPLACMVMGDLHVILQTFMLYSPVTLVV